MTIFSLYFPIFLSLSLSFLLPTIINLFKKTIHHVLTTFHIDKLVHLNCHNHISSLAAGLGITTVTKHVKGLSNVPQSETVKPAPPLSSTTTIERETGAGGIGVIDDIGHEDVNDGLISCTESLGSESSDERRKDYRKEEINNTGDDYDCRRMRMAESRGRWKNEVKSFPPPLSSLNRNGQPSFFLRPVRKDGRLKLTEVRIHRPEILHASRENGRLRLHLVPDESFLDDLEEEEAIQEQEEDITETEEEEEKREVEEIKYKKEWNFGMRCHEMVNHHVHGSHRHHHHLQICGVGIV